MNLLDSLLLGVLQGLTEFLPISSSGHLVIFEQLLSLPVEDLKSFDVAVHIGTLLSILVYFWKDIISLLKAFALALQGEKSHDKIVEVNPLRLAGIIILATFPAIIFGLLGEDWIDSIFRDSKNVGYALLATALFFILVEYMLKRIHKSTIDTKRGFFIGLMQAIAIIPGVSRSGSTIGAGLLMGISREEAARFSFLLGIPALVAAGAYTAYKMTKSNVMIFDMNVYLLGFFSSFISGYLAIYFLMKFLKKHSLAWFSIYLIPLSLYLLLYQS